MKKGFALILSAILLLTSSGMTAFAMDLSSPIVSGNGYLSIGYFAGDSVQIVDRLQTATKRYTDETCDYSWLGDAEKLEADPTLAQVAKDLLGATYIQPSHAADCKNEAYWRGQTKWIEFTLTHSATVYYMTADRRAATPNPWLTNDGWQWYTKEGVGTTPANDNSAWFVNSNNWIQGRMFLLKKDIIASPEKPVTITANGGVGYVAANGPVYSFAIQWKEDSEIIKPQVVGNLSIDSYYNGLPSDIGVVEEINHTTTLYSDEKGSAFDTIPDCLEGAMLIQGQLAWKDNADFKSTSGNISNWITFTITRPATIYYLTANRYYGESANQRYLYQWLHSGDWTWATPSGGKPESDADSYFVNTTGGWQKARIFPVKTNVYASESEPYTLTVPNMGATNSSYSFAIQWAPTLTVTSTGNGTVTPAGTTKVFKGSEQTITAVPADGWKVESVKINGVDSAALDSFSVTVHADTAVEVNFAEIPETPPTLSTFDKTYVPDDKTNSVTFGTVSEGSKTTVKEYGIVYSATDSEDPQIGKENCYKLQAKKALSANGHYGIEIKGDLLLNTTYYTRTYVIYRAADGTEQTIYGDMKTISLR